MANKQEGYRRISTVLCVTGWLGLTFTVLFSGYVYLMYGPQHVDEALLIFPVISGLLFGLAYIFRGFTKPE